jgi:FkbM family methyltransferase
MRTLIKKIYRAIPFKSFIFSILKKIWHPPESVYKHLNFTGIIKVKLNKHRSFRIKHYGYQVENEIFWAGINGRWEKNSLNLWRQLCLPAKVIFDIGANTGIYSLIAKSLNEDADVFAFEPVKRVYDKLVVNNLLNSYNINCIPKAVSNATGTALIYDNSEEHEYAATLNKDNSGNILTSSAVIETIRLDDFISEQGLNRIDLMKIDVESHEPAVLEGFHQGIRKFIPTILIEVLSNDIGSQLFELIRDMDYLYFSIDEEDGIRQTASISRGKNFNYLLCSKEKAEYLKII